MNDVIHEAAHEVHSQTTPSPFARQSSEIHPGRQARRRGATVLQLDPQGVGTGKKTQPNGLARFAVVGVLDHVRHRFSHRHGDLFRGGRIEALGDRRPPRRLVHEAQAFAGRRYVNLERRPIRRQGSNRLW